MTTKDSIKGRARHNAVGFFAIDLGDVASLLGLLVALWMIYRSKTASEAARDAARETRQRLATSLSVVDMSDAMNAMEEILALQQRDRQDWKHILGKYSRLRRLLAAARAAHVSLTEQQRGCLQNALAQLSFNAGRVGDFLSGKEAELDTARLNEVISKQLEELSAVIAELKGRM